jgi:hypothetical protein
MAKAMEALKKISNIKLPKIPTVHGKWEDGYINMADLPFISSGEPLMMMISTYPADESEPEVVQMKEITAKWIADLHDLQRAAIRRLALKDAEEMIKDTHA